MESKTRTNQIPLDLIDAPRVSMRTTIDDEDMEELMADLRVHGLIEPIVVRPIGDRYEIIAGHRRHRAARLLGWELIEAKIMECDDDTAFALRLAENLQRRDVSVVDEASYVGELLLRTKKSAPELAKMLHRSAAWVDDRVAVFEMPDYLKDHLHYKRLSLGAALWLTKLRNENTRRYYSNWAGLNGCSVMQARRWVELELAIEQSGAGGLPASPNDVPLAPVEQILYDCAQCGDKAPVEHMTSVMIHRGQCPGVVGGGEHLVPSAPPSSGVK